MKAWRVTGLRARAVALRGRFALIAAGAVLLLAGCALRLVGYRDYHGDGSFTGHAAPSVICADGYTVDLGALDLSEPGTAHFTLQGLPAVESVIGVALTLSPDAVAVRWPQAAVSLTLRDAKGVIVIGRQEPLGSWIRQRGALGDAVQAFLYLRGTSAEIAERGGVRVERFPIGPDDSWGTYFTPRRGERYTLEFSVETPAPAIAGAQARLQVQRVTGCL